MEKQKKNQRGITLIALVISIIVMLILAGVSLNATVGNNGIVTKAQIASISQRMATLKEELEMNIVKAMGDDFIDKREWVTVLNDNIRNYIPSIEDDEIGKYGIVAGELYYIGEDEIYKDAARNVGVHAIEDGSNLDDFVADVESKAIENIVKTMGEKLLRNAINNEDENRKGIKLANKQVGNPEWAIITEVDGDRTVATYGTGWYFVEKGTELEDIGILKNDYIINYETSKAIRFDGHIHTILSNSSSVAVRKGLILNIDPSAIENRSAESFGEGAELVGYKTDLSDAFTSTSFVFDGIDNHINMPINKTDLDKGLSMNGFTYEFYGKIKGLGNHVLYNNSTGTYSDISQPGTYYDSSYLGVFGIWNGRENSQAYIRFGFYPGYSGNVNTTLPNDAIINQIHYDWAADSTETLVDDFYVPGCWWHHRVNISEANIKFNNDFHYAVSIDPINELQSIYINGVLFTSGHIYPQWWEKTLNNDYVRCTTYTFGRCSMSYEGAWHYLNGDVYSLKFYNRALSADEILANYNASVAYHNILVRGGNFTTGGNTGDGNLSDVETTEP